MTAGYLGIDAGTQGLSVIFTDERLNIVATGEGAYDMLTASEDGCYEQSPRDWEQALLEAMSHLRARLGPRASISTKAIGISGQMHGEVLVNAQGDTLGPVRLWCDSRNEAEGQELTHRLGVKMPKRITAARWLATTRTRPAIAKQTDFLTTPAGWIAFRLTGQRCLGIGDSSGMFPISQYTLNYDDRMLSSFEELTAQAEAPKLRQLLPTARRAGEDGGALTSAGAKLLDLEPGIPVAPAEGDQPAALAGSLIGDAGLVSVSFGTSVCANSVGDRAFQGVTDSIDHFCAADGQPINMVFLRNGTTFMNSLVEMLGSAGIRDAPDSFASVMPLLVAAPADCGGVLALPFMDDEPGLGINRGQGAMLVGLNDRNATPGNVAKAALLATMFNLRIGSAVLDEQGFPRKEIILSGGLTKTPALGQILADVFDCPVSLLESAEEGTAWGAALLAAYRHLTLLGEARGWSAFLAEHRKPDPTHFEPETSSVRTYAAALQRYRELMSRNSR